MGTGRINLGQKVREFRRGKKKGDERAFFWVFFWVFDWGTLGNFGTILRALEYIWIYNTEHYVVSGSVFGAPAGVDTGLPCGICCCFLDRNLGKEDGAGEEMTQRNVWVSRWGGKDREVLPQSSLISQCFTLLHSQNYSTLWEAQTTNIYCAPIRCKHSYFYFKLLRFL